MTDDSRTQRLFALELEAIERLDGINQGDTTTGDDTLFERRFSGFDGIFDTEFFLFHFDFRGGPNLDNTDAAGQFGNSLE